MMTRKPFPARFKSYHPRPDAPRYMFTDGDCSEYWDSEDDEWFVRQPRAEHPSYQVVHVDGPGFSLRLYSTLADAAEAMRERNREGE